jgi:hypothetical protein
VVRRSQGRALDDRGDRRRLMPGIANGFSRSKRTER